MLRVVVLLPGVMGSSLVQGGEEIWPPGPLDLVIGYRDIERLMADDVQVDRIIDSVFIKGVYRTLLRDIERCGYTKNGPQRFLIEHPYDWRKSNAVSARGLVDHLDRVLDGDVERDITIIGHSMGGLVARRVLEGPEYRDRPWFGQIRRLVTLGTPHFGAAKAMSRLQGNERVLGVAGSDVVLLASDPRYPSLYELAGPTGTAFAIDEPVDGELPRVLDRFSSDFVGLLGLVPENITAANEFWEALDLDRRPEDVDYYFVGGAAHATATSCAPAGNRMTVTTSESAGDGTVPVSSAVVVGIPHSFSQKEHARIFEDRSVREALYRFLDAPDDVRPQSADANVAVGAEGAVGISVDQEGYLVGEPIEVALSYARPIDMPDDTFFIHLLHPDSDEPPVEVAAIEFSLDAARVSNITVTIGPDLSPGLYQLTTTRPSDDPQPTIFVVTDA